MPNELSTNPKSHLEMTQDLHHAMSGFVRKLEEVGSYLNAIGFGVQAKILKETASQFLKSVTENSGKIPKDSVYKLQHDIDILTEAREFIGAIKSSAINKKIWQQLI